MAAKASASDFTVDLGVTSRFGAFLNNRIGPILGRREQKESFAIYAQGILGDGERKSVEPIAARATANEVECERMMARLLQFLRVSRWNDRLVRLEAARYAIDALQTQEPVTCWVIDDTGFPKQGTHSVGVQRQYSGTLGKVGNCQIGVSLSVATAHEHLPIDFELYLPTSWTEDPARRKEAKIPEEVVFKTKPELAMDLISRAVGADIPGEIVLTDSAYGGSSDFRNVVRMYGFDFGVGVSATTRVWPLSATGCIESEPITARAFAAEIGPRAFRNLHWRVGTKGKTLSSRFAFRRVKVANDDGTPAADREPMWLVMEWPKGEVGPTKFVLTTLPSRMTKKQIVRIFKERWRTERAYEDLKGELGLDHFEGRSFPGWHHHVSVVLCCYAFIVAERVRHFPPSGECQDRDHQIPCAA